MNTIQGLIDRQLGIYCRLNYDYVLKRLIVDSEESFYGLQSANVIPTFDQDPPIFACRFAEAAGFEHILALANEDGRVAIQDTSSAAKASTVESFQCHNNAVFDLAWMPGNMNFVTVSGDHTASLWDAGEGAPRQALVFAGHSRSVKTAVFRPREPAVFATGARDGHVLVWDVRCSAPAAALKPDNVLAACHAGFAPKTPGSHGKRRPDARAISITGLAFQHEHTLLSCGECDGNIKAWDLRKNYSAYRREPLPKHSIPYCGSSTRNGYTNLVVDSARVRLYASCMDNVIYCFNVATYAARPERRYTGHENGTFYIKTCLSPDGAYLVSGSSDKHAYVWSVDGPRPVARLAGHRAEVTCAAWRRGAEPCLVTCSDDARHMLWRVGPEELERDRERALRGRAEPAPRGEDAAPAPATPASLKRRAPAAPPSGGKRPRPGPERRTKRCLADLMEAARDSAPAASPAKRPRAEPPQPAPPQPVPPQPEAERLLAAGTKRLHDGSPGAARGEASRSPARTPPPPAPRTPPRSSPPTRDLPDFVSTGEAPHLRLMSPGKRRGAAPDWLTALARARRPVPPVARVAEESARRPPAEEAARRTPAEEAARRTPAEDAARRTPAEDAARRTPASEAPRERRGAGGPLLRYFSLSVKK